MIKVILASNNLHKAEEFKHIFDSEEIDIQLIMPSELNLNDFDVEETGTTFEENAFIKAKAFAEASGIPAISDDSGLEVDALDLAPGVYSARYSGYGANDISNRKMLIEKLKDIPEGKRSARFRSVICYFDGDNAIFGRGSIEGKIAFEEKGTGGFGYDSIFIPNNYNLTFAEISPKEKNEISHRKKGIMDFIRNFRPIR